MAKLKDLYQHEMDYLNGLSQLTAPAPNQTEQTARDIQSSMEKIVEEETGELPQVEDEVPEEEPEQEVQEDGGLYAELLGMDRKDKEEQPEPRREHRSDRNDRRARRHDEDEEDEDDSPTRRIDFSNLKFGKDYEIK